MTKLTESELNELLRSNPDVDLIERHSATQSAQSDGTGRLPPATPVQRERALQAAIFAEADRRAVDDPRWALLTCIPNGLYRRGQRPEPGMKAGLPDILMPVASRGFHALWIELKAGNNKPSPAQRAWIDALEEQGYAVDVIWDYAEYAVELIEWYLSPET